MLMPKKPQAWIKQAKPTKSGYFDINNNIQAPQVAGQWAVKTLKPKHELSINSSLTFELAKENAQGRSSQNNG